MKYKMADIDAKCKMSDIDMKYKMADIDMKYKMADIDKKYKMADIDMKYKMADVDMKYKMDDKISEFMAHAQQFSVFSRSISWGHWFLCNCETRGNILLSIRPLARGPTLLLTQVKGRGEGYGSRDGRTG